MSTAEEYFNLLAQVYPSEMSKEGLNPVREIWDAFDKNGIKKPDNLASLYYNSTNYYYQAFDKLKPVIKEAHLYESTRIGLFSLGHFNACSETTENGDYVITIDQNFVGFFFSLFNALFVLAYGKTSEQERKNVIRFIEHQFRGRRDPDYVSDQAGYFHRFSIELVKRDYELSLWSGISVAATLLFILGHELGHHALGHTTTGKLHFYNQQNQSLSVDTFTQQKELEADAYGYRLFLDRVLLPDVGNTPYIPVDFAGMPLLMFRITHLANVFYKSQGLSELSKGEYPAEMERLSKLETFLYQHATKEEIPLYVHLVDVIDVLQEKYQES